MATSDYRVPDERKRGDMIQTRGTLAARKRRMILDLRSAGLSEEQIAEQMTQQGMRMSQQAVHSSLKRMLAKLAQEQQGDVDEMRQLELVRIEQAIQVLWPKVREGNLKAMREYRAFIDQKARLLGLNAAIKHEVNGDINHVLSLEDKQEIKRLEEAFVTAQESALQALPPAAVAPEIIKDMEIVDAEVVDEPSSD